MMRYFLLVLVLLFSALSGAAQAQEKLERIAAVVNSDAISFTDVDDRLHMIIASSGLPNAPDVREKLLPQVMNTLIEEQLKLQEAERLEIVVDDADIENGLGSIAQQNNMELEPFREALARAGIRFSTMERQIEAQIAWNTVVQNTVRPRIVVSDNDVDARMERFRHAIGKSEFLVSEIFLPVDEPSQEGQTRQLALKVVSDLRGNRAPFSRVAQQLSKAPGAAQGGDLGWVSEGQLAEDLDRALARMEAGGISDPIRSLSGYHILQLRDVREISEDNLPEKEKVKRTILLERIERAQKRLLLDLRSAAFIEHRV